MGAFMSGFGAGLQHDREGKQRQDAISDDERHSRSEVLMHGMSLGQQKLATLQPGTPEHTELSNELSQAQNEWTDLFHPRHGPEALAHLGRIVSEKILHRQPPADPARISTVQTQAATPPSTLPGMNGGAPMNFPGTPATSETKLADAPPRTAAEARQRTDQFMSKFAQHTATDPLVAAGREAEFNRTQQGETFDWQRAFAQKHGLSDEALDELTQHQLGIPNPKLPKALTGDAGKPFQGPDKQWYYKAQDQTNGGIIDVPLGPDYQPPAPKQSTSSAATQRREYAIANGFDPDKPLPWKDKKGKGELDMQRQMFSAHNPYAGGRFDLAKQGFQLRESESGLKDFMALQKQLTPLERVVGTADSVDTYVQKPTGPGDVALTLAFFDAIKTTGVRFTKQEQDFITGSRGALEGFQAKFDGGFSGTVFGPDQRKIIAGIIKKAAGEAQKQKNTLVTGAGQFRPKVAAAVNGAASAGPSVDDIVNALNNGKK